MSNRKEHIIQMIPADGWSALFVVPQTDETVSVEGLEAVVVPLVCWVLINRRDDMDTPVYQVIQGMAEVFEHEWTDDRIDTVEDHLGFVSYMAPGRDLDDFVEQIAAKKDQWVDDWRDKHR